MVNIVGSAVTHFISPFLSTGKTGDPQTSGVFRDTADSTIDFFSVGFFFEIKILLWVGEEMMAGYFYSGHPNLGSSRTPHSRKMYKNDSKIGASGLAPILESENNYFQTH